MNYTAAIEQFDLFMYGLETYYAGEFAGCYDWDAVRDDLLDACVYDDGGFWVFEEPDNDLIVSVLQSHDRGC